jgi:hypothetical protein
MITKDDVAYYAFSVYYNPDLSAHRAGDLGQDPCYFRGQQLVWGYFSTEEALKAPAFGMCQAFYVS